MAMAAADKFLMSKIQAIEIIKLYQFLIEMKTHLGDCYEDLYVKLRPLHEDFLSHKINQPDLMDEIIILFGNESPLGHYYQFNLLPPPVLRCRRESIRNKTAQQFIDFLQTVWDTLNPGEYKLFLTDLCSFVIGLQMKIHETTTPELEQQLLDLFSDHSDLRDKLENLIMHFRQ
ncbi:hypothetical protein CHUAL_002302 [Chamberlinius hualienensis]